MTHVWHNLHPHSYLTCRYILVASMDRAMRIYSPNTYEVVQQHTGHSDAVRSIIHGENPHWLLVRAYAAV